MKEDNGSRFNEELNLSFSSKPKALVKDNQASLKKSNLDSLSHVGGPKSTNNDQRTTSKSRARSAVGSRSLMHSAKVKSRLNNVKFNNNSSIKTEALMSKINEFNAL